MARINNNFSRSKLSRELDASYEKNYPMQCLQFSASFRNWLSRSDNKVAKIIYMGMSTRNWPVWKYVFTHNELNYLTFRKSGTISYLPNGKELKYNDDGEWSRDGRQFGRPARVIRKIFTKKGLSMFSDADFEAFSNSYISEFSSDGYDLLELPNKEIPSIYSADNVSDEGSIGGSCMNGEPESFFDIYGSCEHVSIIVLRSKEDGMIHGRALLWSLPDGSKFMDRVYVSKDFLYETFLSYAKEKGYWRKLEYKSYSDKSLWVNPENGSSTTRNVSISVNLSVVSKYPYIDTFSYGDDYSINNYHDGPYQYNNTDGTRDGDGEDDSTMWDDIREETIDECDAVSLSSRSSRRYQYLVTHVDNTVCVDGEFYYIEDDVITKVGGYYYRTDSDDIVFSQREYRYILSDDAVYVEDIEDYVPSDDAVYDIDGTWRLKDDCEKVDGNWYKIDDSRIIRSEDGTYALAQIEETEA